MATVANLSQADKLTTLVKAAGVNEFEPIWATLFAKVGAIPFLALELEEAADDNTDDNTDKPQALEGKDVKSMLLNVGSGGGAAAAPAAGGAAAAGGADAAEEAKEEEAKEEGGFSSRTAEALQLAVLGLDDETLQFLKAELMKSAIIMQAITDEAV